MSIKAMNWAWDVEGLTAPQKLVLLKLADRANDDGQCWPGNASIREACGIKSKRTLIRIIQFLEECQLISIDRRRDPDNPARHDTNLYTLHIDRLDLLPGANIALGQKLPRGNSEQKVGQKLPQGGANIAPESKRESKKEPLKPSSSGDEAREPVVYDSAKGAKLTGDVLERFDRFWEAFGYKAGKSQAADSWLDTAEPRLKNGSVSMEHILHAAQQEAKRRAELRAKGATPKMAQGWLTARRWEDFEPPGGRKPPAETVPWYHRWSGIVDEAANRGILTFEYPNPRDLTHALIEQMKEAGDEVPPGLRDYHRELIRREARA